MLPLKLRFSVPAARLMSTALPTCAFAVFQVLPMIASASVPVVPAERVTSMPSAPALSITLFEMVNVDAPDSGRAVVRSMALMVEPSASPVTSVATAPPMVTALPAPPLMNGRCAALAGTRVTGAALPLSARLITSPAGSPIRCWLASRPMPVVMTADAPCRKM